MNLSAMGTSQNAAVRSAARTAPPTVFIPAAVEDYATVSVCAPPNNLPVRLAPGQILLSLDYAQGDERGSIGYFVNDHKVHLVHERGFLPTGEVLREVVQRIFDRHPMVTKFIADLVLNDFSEFPDAHVTLAKTTYLLDLPESFEQYRQEFVSRELRSSVERKERKASRELPGFGFEIIEGPRLTPEVLSEAANLIEAHLRRKDPASEWRAADAMAAYEVYAERGFIARLVSEGRPVAVTLCIRHLQDQCYFFAAAFDDSLPRYSLGLICMYRVIESLIADGVRRFHLGGGDYGYKSRFGAVERPLYNIEIERNSPPPLAERVELALRAGARPFWVESEINQSLEELLGDRFAAAVGVDFAAPAERDGTDSPARPDQASSRAMFFGLLEAIKPASDDVFVGVGSGPGRELYYAARLGFARCLGIEVDASLLQWAERNLRRLRLTADVELLLRDPGETSAAELAAGTVFYICRPFDERTLTRFLATLADSQALRPRSVTVVYPDARFTTPFEQNGFVRQRELKTGVNGWTYRRSAIYLRA